MQITDDYFPGAKNVETPAVVIDEGRLSANLSRMRAIVPDHIALVPHVKTHKCLEIATRQLREGASGFTASKPGEAAVFIKAGVAPVLIAYPLIRAQTIKGLIAAGVQAGVAVRFIADSKVGVQALSDASSASTTRPIEVFIKIDVGLHRCGIDAESEVLLELANSIIEEGNLRFGGLLSHAGHAYGAASPDAVRAVAAQELQLLRKARLRLEAEGIAVPGLSVGSTPTLLSNAGFDGVTEVRPGNYVFLDMTAVRLGIAARSDIALAVVASVVSCNDRYAIIDAGSKVLSSDLGAHGTAANTTFGEAWQLDGEECFDVVRLSEEHGFLDAPGQVLSPGDKVLIFPNHACPVANLAKELTLLSSDLPQTLRVDARAATR